jgi:methylated-DNA-[protein]-cysteine S-methyltransferase
MPVRGAGGGASVVAVHSFETPIGTLWLEAERGGLSRIAFEGLPGAASDDVLLREAEDQLRAYFAGELRRFELPLAPRGTDFQRRVWDVVAAIPYGSTSTYSALAEAIGSPRACRAVGAANGRNPLPIVVPCHRVLGASGALTGYGGGLHAKRALLELEGAAVRPRLG